jgi:DegV family protein with EDD domain
MSIAIVTDSTADLPRELLEEHSIQVVPAMVILNGTTYTDGDGLSREDFYQRMTTTNELPTTSAPPITMFQQMYEMLLKDGASQVISIHVSSAFSGIHNIASAAAQAFMDKINVIDSGQVTFGLGFQALAAAEAAGNGANLDEVRQIVERVSQKVRFIALLDSLEYVRRSGRVHWAAATVSNFFNLKAMIEVRKGDVLRLGLFRNRTQGITSLIKHLCSLGPLDRLAIVYTNLSNMDEINHILESVKSQLKHPAIVAPVTTVIGTHVGSDCIGFIALPV